MQLFRGSVRGSVAGAMFPSVYRPHLPQYLELVIYYACPSSVIVATSLCISLLVSLSVSSLHNFYLLETMAAPETAAPAAGHRRNKSASVLKSLMIPKNHKRTPSDGLELKKNHPVNAPYLPASNFQAPLLPPDHPDSQIRAATRTENIPINPPSPQKSRFAPSSPKKSLHKKTLSSVSLRSLAKGDEKTTNKKSMDVRRPREEEVDAEKPKKSKSSTNLAAMFGKGRSKEGKQSPTKQSPTKQSPTKQPSDKENTTPPSSASAAEPPRAPIWAEFSSTPLQEVTTTSRVPLNDQRRSIEEEIALYTPQNYSPTKQRNFFDYGQPSLQQHPTAKERPKSMVVPKSTSTTSILDTFSRKKSNERVPLSDTKGNEGRTKENVSSRNAPSRPPMGRASTDTSRKDDASRSNSQPAVAAKKPNRVMAAVAAFNGRSRQMEAPTSPTKLDPKVVDTEFEEVLVCAWTWNITNSTDMNRNRGTSLRTSAPRCEHSSSK